MDHEFLLKTCLEDLLLIKNNELQMAQISLKSFEKFDRTLSEFLDQDTALSEEQDLLTDIPW